jgi:hypothetical protein
MNELNKVTAQTIIEFVNVIKNLSPQIWSIYLKQTITSAWIDIITIAIIIIVVSLFSMWSFNKSNKLKEVDKYDDVAMWLFIISIVGSLVCFILLLVGFWDPIKQLMNTEYYTIKSLANDMWKR